MKDNAESAGKSIEREPQIVAQNNKTAIIAARLCSKVSDLEDRLVSALREPEPNKTAGVSEKEAECTVPMAATIKETNDTLTAQVSRIADIIERLEL